MAAVGTFLVLVLACLAAGALGDYSGRKRERKRLLSPRRFGEPDSRRIDQTEVELRRAKGLRPLHPDPDHATRVSKLNIKRR